jgi:hypothetical protein
MITLKHDIRIMKWDRARNERPWVFAKAHTFRGGLILWLRGYRPHETAFGTVMRKDL